MGLLLMAQANGLLNVPNEIEAGNLNLLIVTTSTVGPIKCAVANAQMFPVYRTPILASKNT